MTNYDRSPCRDDSEGVKTARLEYRRGHSEATRTSIDITQQHNTHERLTPVDSCRDLHQFQPGTEREQALADTSRSRYVVIVTKPVHRLQIRQIVHN